MYDRLKCLGSSTPDESSTQVVSWEGQIEFRQAVYARAGFYGGGMMDPEALNLDLYNTIMD